MLERRRPLEQRTGKERGRENRIRMRVEDASRDNGARERGVRVPLPGADARLAAEPRDANFHPHRIDRARRRERAGGGECRKEQREAQAPVHVRKYDMPRVI